MGYFWLIHQTVLCSIVTADLRPLACYGRGSCPPLYVPPLVTYTALVDSAQHVQRETVQLVYACMRWRHDTPTKHASSRRQ